MGWLGAYLLRRVALPASGLYPLVVFAFTVLAYGSSAAVHASGFAAVYVAALVLGNAELPHRMATRSFVEGIGWLAQIGLFVMLGLLASPEELRWWHVGQGIAIGAILTFVARPLTVAACAMWFGRSAREQVFVGWAGLRGAVPIVLATIPLSAGVAGSRDLFNIVFVAVVIYTLLQAAPLARLAAACGVLTDDARDVEVEAAPLERVSADLLQIHVPKGSKLRRRRGGRSCGCRSARRCRSWCARTRRSSPHRTDRIAVDDDLLIVTARSVREATEVRLHLVGRYGRLAGWGTEPV
ncbi:cation:proton antiporter [Aeromicrobium sp. UC242_57]|uniref:cation:proton antiporter domain-containing protein n=1 Tax=Aeromicrobium sp. UC242_57 TaxID=3374624 RepID=UPI0037B1CDE6